VVRATALLDRFPVTSHELAECLQRLQGVLSAARAARTELIVTSIRVRAAAGFALTPDLPSRHVFGATPES
jgi:hypothetical protein